MNYWKFVCIAIICAAAAFAVVLLAVRLYKIIKAKQAEKAARQPAIETAAASEEPEAVMYDVAAPDSAAGYTVSEPTETAVKRGESYGFTLTLEPNCPKAPKILLRGGNGTVKAARKQSDAIYAYTVTNVMGNIAAVDYNVDAVLVEPVVRPAAEPVAETIRVPAPEEKEPQKESEKPLFFTLSRNDVMDHIAEMQKNGERFPVKPAVNEKTIDKMPDFLMCSGWCFAMMFDRNDIVFNFILRMSPELAGRYGKAYSIQNASSVSGENWYSLVINRFFESKREVYAILDDCYEYTLMEYFANKKKAAEEAPATERYAKEEKAKESAAKGEETAKAEQAAKEDKEREERAAKEEQAALVRRMSENLALIEKTAAAAEAEYRLELEKYKAENYTKFLITRKEIADDTRAFRNPDISVVERPKQPQLPMSLRYKDKTYAMLHGTDTGVIMIARLADSYADDLSARHPEICRAGFPKGPNWYYIPVDGAFSDKESVYRLLAAAREFVARENRLGKRRRG